MVSRRAVLPLLAFLAAAACSEPAETGDAGRDLELALTPEDEQAIELMLVEKQREFLRLIYAADRSGMADLLDPQFRWGPGPYRVVNPRTGEVRESVDPPEADYLRMLAGFTPEGFDVDDAWFRVRRMSDNAMFLSVGPDGRGRTLVTTWRRSGEDWRATGARIFDPSAIAR